MVVFVHERTSTMVEQSNKPGGSINDEGQPRPATEQRSVKNQSVVKPSDYPEPAGSELLPPEMKS